MGTIACFGGETAVVASYREAEFDIPIDVPSPIRSVPAPQPNDGPEPDHLDELRALGWDVECRGCFWLAVREHRRIEIFRDGRVVFKDPSIKARYQLDDEWLQVIRFVWPNVQF